MPSTVSVTVRVPKELKKQMERIRINWSEYIRQAIEKRIELEEAKKASAKLDEIRRRAKPVSTGEIVAWIRADRGR